jgi:hypothetical protein
VTHLQGDVAGMAPGDRGARTVRVPRTRAALAARTRASSAPARRVTKTEVELPSASCHDLHCDMQV